MTFGLVKSNSCSEERATTIAITANALCWNGVLVLMEIALYQKASPNKSVLPILMRDVNNLFRSTRKECLF